MPCTFSMLPSPKTLHCWTKITGPRYPFGPLKNQLKCQNNMFNCSTHIHPYNIIHVLKKKNWLSGKAWVYWFKKNMCNFSWNKHQENQIDLKLLFFSTYAISSITYPCLCQYIYFTMVRLYSLSWAPSGAFTPGANLRKWQEVKPNCGETAKISHIIDNLWRKWLSHRGSFTLALQGSNIKCQVILIGQQFTPSSMILGWPLAMVQGCDRKASSPISPTEPRQRKWVLDDQKNEGEYNPNTIINRPSFGN